MLHKSRCVIPLVVVIFLALLFGICTALVWCFGYGGYVRLMVPYALVVSALIFVVTAILKAKCGNPNCSNPCLECPISSTSWSLRKFAPIIMIASMLAIVLILIILATCLPFVCRVIIAFCASISFWTMILAFVAMVLCIVCKR